MKWWDRIPWSSFFECWVQESWTRLIHNEAGEAVEFLNSPTSIGGNFPFKWGVRGRKTPPPLFLRASPFWILSPCRSHLLSFLPGGPCQLLLCSPAHLQPGLSLIKTSLNKTFLLIKTSLLIKSSAQMFLELRVGEQADPAWAISHFSDSSQETPIFKELLKAFLPHLLGFHCKAKTISLTSSLFWLAMLRCACQADVQREPDPVQGRETNVPGSSLKAPVPVGCVNDLALHSCSSRDTDVSKQPASTEAAPVLLGAWVLPPLDSSAPLSLGSTPFLPYSPHKDKSMVIA